jgi:alpha-glucoside transport system permease protein
VVGARSRPWRAPHHRTPGGRDIDGKRRIRTLIAIVVGVGGVLVLFWALNYLVERLPKKQEELLKPYVFIGPALVVVGVFLLYPSILTIIDSFRTNVGTPDERWTLDNYVYLFTDRRCATR